MKISVCVPLYNEEEVIRECHGRISKVLKDLGGAHEIIFIDDGSGDRTLELLEELAKQDPQLKALSFSRNFGHPVAISAGLEYATGDVVIIADADLQDPPEVFPALIEKWKEGYKVVYGIRRKRKEWWGKRAAYWCFYRLLQRLTHFPIPLDAGDFCLLDREVVNVMKSFPERNRFLRGLRSWAGFRQVGLPYERAERFAGTTKYPLRKLFRLAADGIFSFSYVPLRIATFFGFFVAGFAFIAVLALLYMRVVYGVIGFPGFSSTLIVILFLGGIQLVAIGILGEYTGRVYDEVKRRPLYVTKKKIGL